VRYEQPIHLTRMAAESELESGSAQRVRDALISLALNDPDWRWVQDVCLRFASDPDASIRAISATSLGHLARIHGALDLARVLPVLRKLLEAPETAGYAETALDDIGQFIGDENAESSDPSQTGR
jgi:hypothetical protein